MPNKEEYSKKINEVSTILDEILSFNIEKDLIKSEELGKQLNFIECKETFEAIIEITKELKGGNIDKFPFNILNTIASQTKAILNKLREISNFNPKTQLVNRENLIIQIRDHYENYYTNIFDILNHIKLQKLQPSVIEMEVKKNLDYIAKTSIEANSKLKEISEVLTKAKQAAGKTGVAEYSSYFRDEAADHEGISKKWLYAVIGMSLLTIIWGVILLFWIRKNLTTGETIQYSIAKFIVLSILFYGVIWSTRNYNAHRHNYVVNKHRSNSLNSFETFVKSTEDTATKDAVLLQATQSIFSPQSSGYDHSDGDGDLPNKFIEILRHVEPRSK